MDAPIIFLVKSEYESLLRQTQSLSLRNCLVEPIRKQELASILATNLHCSALERQLRHSRSALLASEARYNHLFEHSPLGIFQTTLQGKLLTANNEMARMLGFYTPEEACRTFVDIGSQMYVDPEQRRQFLEILCENGVVRNFEFLARRKNGEIFWMSTDARLALGMRYKEDNDQIIDGFAVDITSRRTAEHALKEGDQRHRIFLMNSPNGVFAADLAGRIVQVNPTVCRISGYQEHELLKMNVADLHFSDNPVELQQYLRQAGHQDRFSQEIPVRTKGGQQRWWSVTLIHIAKQNLIGFCTDVTDRRRAEETLRVSEFNFRNLFASMTDLLIVAKQDGSILLCNDEVHQVLGYSSSDLAAMRVSDLVPVEQRAALEAALTNIQENINQDRRFPLQTHNGKLIPVNVRMWLGQWDARASIFLTCRNLSSEEEAEQRFEQLFRHNPALMAVTSLNDGRFIDVNDAWLETTGFSRDEVIGKTPDELNFFHNSEKHQQAEKDAVENGRRVNVELEIRCKDGSSRHGLFSGETIQTHGQLYVLTVIIDITERKRIETALERRMLALLRPLDSAEDLAIEDLFNLEDLQLFQDLFAKATGVASLITLPDGTPVTKPSNFTRLCGGIIRQTAIGQANCQRSDALVGQGCIHGPNVRHCLGCGLWDAGAAIVVGDRHLANWLIGQVRDASQTDEKMRRYARLIGTDETEFLEAFHEIPTMTREQFTHVGEALFALVTRLSASAYQNIQQARFITERKQAEEALRASEERLQQLFRVAPAGIGVVRDRIFLEINGRICEMLGYSSDELVNQSVRKVYPTTREYESAGMKTYQQINEHGISEIETRWQQRNGAIIDILLASILIDTADASKGVIFTALDITERKRAESMLRASETRYRELVENANSIILRMDSNGTLSFFNEYAQRFFGFTTEEVIGKNIVGTIVPETDSAGRDLRKMIAEIGRTPHQYATNENENILRDGSRVWISWTNRPFYTEEGEVSEILCVGNDITEQKRTEEEKALLQAQLNQSQKLEAIGTLAGGIAHDFNNILAAVIGYADLAREEVPDDTYLAKNIDQILQAGNRAKDLVKQILAFSRQSSTETAVFMPATIIGETVKLLRPALPTTITIDMQLDPQAGPVCIDPTQFHQILMNLCTNAFHAMEKNCGTLTIGLSEALLNYTDLPASVPGGPGKYVVIAVRDTGSGIDDTIRSRIFDPFFTTKAAGKGTGMGLSIIHGIVTNRGGFITVDSTVGKGTEFRVYLPISRQDVGENIDENVAISSGSGHILFVDDEIILVEMATRILQKLGYKVTATTSSAEAFSLFSRESAAYDLIITDQTMPEMTGLELSRRMLGLRPDLPIILCTGYSAILTKDDVCREGIRDLLLKPVTKKELAAVVKKALSNS